MSNYRELELIREHKVVKSNLIIQKSRHQWTLQQQKAMAYIISMLKPDQEEFDWMVFDIFEFCKVCGINTSGKNYKDLKATLLGLSNRGFWLELEDGEEITVRWIHRAKISPNSGLVNIKIDEYLKPFLLELQNKFTIYQLRYMLIMSSQYSSRLYELLKSYQNLEKGEVHFDLEYLKRRIGAEVYERWVDVRRKVLDIAVREINEKTDITVSYKTKTSRKKVIGITFTIEEKTNVQELMPMWFEHSKHFDPDPRT